jgi:hypothetical protein
MQRRKFIAGMGSLAAAGAAGLGTGAFNVARADREITVATTGDSSAYLGLVETSAYASGTSSGELTVDISELGDDSNYVLNDVFKIVNNGQDNIIVDLSDSESDIAWDTEFPKAYWSSDELGTTQDVGADGEFNENRPVIPSGEEVYIQFEFVGRDAESGQGPSDAPDIIGVYAEATDASGNLS